MSVFPTRFSVSVSVPFHCLPSSLSLCPPHVSDSTQRVTLETPGPPTAAGTKHGHRAAKRARTACLTTPSRKHRADPLHFAERAGDGGGAKQSPQGVAREMRADLILTRGLTLALALQTSLSDEAHSTGLPRPHTAGRRGTCHGQVGRL